MTQTIKDIAETFSLLDEWEDRYRYIIELGHELEHYPETARDNAHKVPGCVSQVWLTSQRNDNGNDPVLTFKGDSDAHIVKGLVYIILALYSGKRASEILETDARAALAELGLDEHLTPQRSNGLRSMIAHIREEAARNKMDSSHHSV